MDYIAFCQRFALATGVPVHLLEKGSPVYTSLKPLSSVSSAARWNMWVSSKNPEFLAQTENLEYGRVRIEGTDYDIIIGPLFATPITEEIVDEFLSDYQTPQENRADASDTLYNLPLISHYQCLRYLMFLHLCLNHQTVEVEDFYAENAQAEEMRSSEQMHVSVEMKENDIHRDSYAFELQLYHYVEMGDVARLKAFLESVKEFPCEGRMAKSLLRHAKNTMISVAAKASMLGAIPGGLDAEKAYQLLDLYSVECEQLQTIEEVHRLQYIMLMDFCQRAGNAKIPPNISSEIYRCVTYIRNHTNRPLNIDDVARHINRSRSYLMRRFKAETGVQVNVYITRCKLEEACDLLIYGTESLSAISAYLGYSSQSYFQNVFKKEYGMTPMQYRNQNKIIK